MTNELFKVIISTIIAASIGLASAQAQEISTEQTAALEAHINQMTDAVSLEIASATEDKIASLLDGETVQLALDADFQLAQFARVQNDDQSTSYVVAKYDIHTVTAD